MIRRNRKTEDLATMTSETPRTREKYLRAEKTTKNRDDFKVLLVGILFGFLILISFTTLSLLNEQRWYRDLTGKTPFSDVIVTSQVVVNNSITVTGEMIKHRCEFESLTGYISYTDIVNGGVERGRVFVNTKPEDLITGVTGNRPPSDELENWGPWLMTLSLDERNLAQMGEILGYEIWATHKCPTPPYHQSNLFAEGEWRTFNSLEYLEAPKLRELE